MAAAWFITLLVYALVEGYDKVPTLVWLSLIPLLIQDLWDTRKGRS